MSAPVGDDYAGPVSRAVGYLVDAALVAALTIGGVAGVQVIVTVVGNDLREFVRAATPVLLAALPVLLVSYLFVFWGLTGRTPGMALIGVRLTSTAGRPVSWTAALVRAVILGYFPIGYLWCLVDRRRQAVHDKLARTIVVRA